MIRKYKFLWFRSASYQPLPCAGSPDSVAPFRSEARGVCQLLCPSCSGLPNARQNILRQAQMSMLAQANETGRRVVDLLSGFNRA